MSVTKADRDKAQARWVANLRKRGFDMLADDEERFYQEATRADRGRVISTVSLTLACVGMLVWPLGPLVWVLATIAYARTRTSGNPHNGKAVVAATLGFVQMALVFGLVLVHVIPGR